MPPKFYIDYPTNGCPGFSRAGRLGCDVRRVEYEETYHSRKLEDAQNAVRDGVSHK